MAEERVQGRLQTAGAKAILPRLNEFLVTRSVHLARTSSNHFRFDGLGDGDRWYLVRRQLGNKLWPRVAPLQNHLHHVVPKPENLDNLNDFIAGACAHHWVIEKSNGLKSEGVCHRCGETRSLVIHRSRRMLIDRRINRNNPLISNRMFLFNRVPIIQKVRGQ